MGVLHELPCVNVVEMFKEFIKILILVAAGSKRHGGGLISFDVLWVQRYMLVRGIDIANHAKEGPRTDDGDILTLMRNPRAPQRVLLTTASRITGSFSLPCEDSTVRTLIP